MVFLEIPNVLLGTVFVETVTYIICITHNRHYSMLTGMMTKSEAIATILAFTSAVFSL